MEFLIETVLLRQQRHLYLRDLYIHEDEPPAPVRYVP